MHAGLAFLRLLVGAIGAAALWVWGFAADVVDAEARRMLRERKRSGGSN